MNELEQLLGVSVAESEGALFALLAEPQKGWSATAQHEFAAAQFMAADCVQPAPLVVWAMEQGTSRPSYESPIGLALAL